MCIIINYIYYITIIEPISVIKKYLKHEGNVCVSNKFENKILLHDVSNYIGKVRLLNRYIDFFFDLTT